jgi:CBS domain-containing protein/mannitol/fructose-specific phosphotransferase system IIA component (Ntr-type)
MGDAVAVSKLLRPEWVIVGLEAEGYEDAVGRLLDRLDAAGVVSDRAAIDALVRAEIARGDVPSLGSRAVLAHYRTDAARELAVAIGTSPTPFGFAPSAAPEAVFLVLIIAPRAAAKYYLKTLAALSRLLGNAEAADALAPARSREEFLAVLAKHDQPIRPELMVQDLMSRQFHAVSPETLLSEALHLMIRHRRRGVPVLSDNGEVLGLITEVELLQHFLPQVLGPASLRKGEEPEVQDVEVRDVMQRSVMCLSENQLISDVLGTMLSATVPLFPVVKEGKLVGILSRTDLIEKLLKHYV